MTVKWSVYSPAVAVTVGLAGGVCRHNDGGVVLFGILGGGQRNDVAVSGPRDSGFVVHVLVFDGQRGRGHRAVVGHGKSAVALD